MKCPGKKLAAFRDGELSRGERERISAHLAVCPGCRRELERLETLSRDLKVWFETAAGEGGKIPFWERIGGRLEPAAAAERLFWRFRRPGWTVWGALAAASIAAGLFFFAAPRPESPPGNYCRVRSASSPGHGLLIYQEPVDGFTVIWLQE